MTEKPSYEYLEKRIQELEQAEYNRKRSEEKLIHAYGLMDYIISHARSAIAVFDRDFKYIYVSKRYLNDYRVKEKNIIGKHHYEVFPDIPQKWKNIHQRSLAGEVLSAEADPYYRKDGSVNWTRWECRPWYESDALIGGIIIYNEIINERMKIEEALRKSEQLLSSHLLNTPVGVISWDLNLITVEWNPAAETIFGYTKEEAIGKHVAELILPEDMKELVGSIFQNIIIEKGGAHSINENITKNGRRIICDWYNTAQKDTGGKVVGIASLVSDITERKRAEKTLQESEAKFRSIFENKGTATGVYGEDGIIKECNAVFEELSGYSKFEIIDKKKWSDFVVNEDLERLKTYHAQRLTKGEPPPSQYECGIIHRNGEVRTVIININLVGVDRIVSLTDISARKQAEEMQKKLQKQLIQAQKMEAIGTLAGGIAHDFNNILSGIFGYSQLAEIHIDDPKKAKADIRNIVKGASRATQLVQQILTFSRKTDYKKQYLKLFLIGKEVLKLIRSTIPTTIEIKEKFNSKASIFADPVQMHQIIMNLCTNAYHAMSDSGGELTVRLDETYMPDPNNISIPLNKNQKYLELEISDTGHGMDKSIMEKIFDPYFTTKTMEKGTGLGLAFVRAIVADHGGTISVDSSIGMGSTFIIHLPVAEQKSNPDIKTTLEKEIPTGTESILFVEDEDNIRFSIQEFLENYGYALTVSENGQKAYEEFKRAPKGFDIVITDMAMPKMNGDELALKILKIRKDIPIILCTGYSEKLNEAQTKEIGIARYINKPIAGKELCFLIREVLKKEK